MVARLVTLVLCYFVTLGLSAQPQQRRNQQAQQRQQQTTAQKSNANTMTTRAQLSFPTQAPMSEDVVWRRDIYREVDLHDDANAGLYYPKEPVGTQMNLFTYMFKLMMRGAKNGGISAYEYRLDGNELFNDSSRVQIKTVLDNFHIYYEEKDGKIRVDNSDIPSAEVKLYYLKESAYYDQANSSFHRKVQAICPVMLREDDFGGEASKYPLFWVKYADLAPFLSRQSVMTSNLNNAATMSMEDYFTLNRYEGKIYKTNNMLGRTLAQYCPTDSAMAKEQQKIELELKTFEKNLFGDQARRDSIAAAAKQQQQAKAGKKSRKGKKGEEAAEDADSGKAQAEEATAAPKEKKVRTRRTPKSSSSSRSGGTRLSVRRQRH